MTDVEYSVEPVRHVKCPLCDVSASLRGLACHRSKSHRDTSVEQYAALLFFDGVIPTCECGCGSQRTFTSLAHGEMCFSRFLRGHNGFSDDARRKAVEASIATRRRDGSWNKGLTRDADCRVGAMADKASTTLRRRYASGELISWQSGLTKETSPSVRRISESLRLKWNAGELKTWTQGKTKHSDEKLAATAKKISDASFLKRDVIVSRVAEVQNGAYSIVDIEQFAGINAQFTFRHDVCGTTITRCFKGFVKQPLCPTCMPRSHGQRELYEFVSTLCDGVMCDTRSIIHPLELDIYVPSKKFAVEFNGLYWHSEVNKPELYHDEKTRMCHEQGVDLLHVFEDEWRDRRSIVESMVRARLGRHIHSFDARKCKLTKLSHSQADIALRRQFFNANHIDGDTVASHAWMLTHDVAGTAQPVTLISLRRPAGRRSTRMRTWEIARFATLLDSRVRGGLGRLITAVRRDHDVSSTCDRLMTYVDLRHGRGTSYESVGFRRIGVTTTPRFWWTDFECRFNRLKFKADTSHGLSERCVADEAGVVRITCCRNARFELDM
jgi:hypothetical protein